MPAKPLTPLQAQTVLNNWRLHGDQNLVGTVERTLAMARMGGDPRVDAAIILEAVAAVYGAPGAPGAPGWATATATATATKQRPVKAVKRRGSFSRLAGQLANALSMWIATRGGR
jgi:hypothetical protein